MKRCLEGVIMKKMINDEKKNVGRGASQLLILLQLFSYYI